MNRTDIINNIRVACRCGERRAGFSAGEDERSGHFRAVKDFGAGFDRGGGIRAHFAPGGIGIAQVWLYQCARLAAA